VELLATKRLGAVSILTTFAREEAATLTTTLSWLTLSILQAFWTTALL